MCGRGLASILHFSTASSPFAIPTTWLIRLLAASHNYQLPDCLVVVTVSSIPVTLLAFRLRHINIYHHPHQMASSSYTFDNTSSYTFVSPSSPRVIPSPFERSRSFTVVNYVLLKG